MSKYLVTRLNAGQPVPGVSMILEYDDTENSFLTSWIVQGEWTVGAWKYFWKYPPLNETALLRIGSTPEAFVKIELMPDDLSFARFWEEYGHKVGSKAKIEKQFNALSEADRVKVFKAIPRYHRYLQVSGVNQAMASTWLSQERWNNEYSTKPQNKT